MRLGNIKKFIIITIILLPARVLQAQDFSIEAETLVFNRASNIFSARGNVKIYLADTTIKTERLIFNKNSEKINFTSEIIIKTNRFNIIIF